MKTDKPPAGKIIGLVLTAAVILALVLLILNSNLLFPAEERILAPPLKPPEEIVYSTVTVGLSSIENRLSCRGFFQPERQIDVSFKNRDGYLHAIYVGTGDLVKTGDKLAELDTEPLRKEIKRQEIALRGAKANYERLEEISRIETASAKLQLDELRSDLQKKNSLNDSIAKADIARLENQLELQESQYDKTVIEYKYQIAAAGRDIESAELRLNELLLDVERSVLTAPIDGLVAYVAFVNEGEYIPGYKVIVTVADPGSLVLQYNGDKHSSFYLGMPVRVEYMDAFYDGEVVLTPRQLSSDEFEKMKDVVQVRVRGLPAACRQGESGTIEAVLDWAENVIVLPKRLVQKYSGRWFVKVLEDGIVNERDVEVGLESQTEYEITRGLEAGELVVE